MLYKAFIIAFIVMFIYACFLEGMIFGIVRQWLAELNDKYKKPLYSCSICMTPWWGSLAYWAIGWAGKWQVDRADWIIVILIGAGINTVFVKITRY